MADRKPKTQQRGHCQCCGGEWAVPVKTGCMSKHGYQIKNGWFEGPCQGEHYHPIEQDRAVADTIVAQVRKDVAALKKRARDLRSGIIVPDTAKEGPWSRAKEIPFSQASEWEQKRAIESEIHHCELRADMGKSFADLIERAVHTFHGQPLRTVAVDPPPPPIRPGDRRVLPTGPVTVIRINRRSVVCRDGDGHRTLSTLQWRTLPHLETPPEPEVAMISSADLSHRLTQSSVALGRYEPSENAKTLTHIGIRLNKTGLIGKGEPVMGIGYEGDEPSFQAAQALVRNEDFCRILQRVYGPGDITADIIPAQSVTWRSGMSALVFKEPGTQARDGEIDVLAALMLQDTGQEDVVASALAAIPEIATILRCGQRTADSVNLEDAADETHGPQ